MNKCSKCGTEFEGKFCPECGAQWSEEKTCPKCGANLHGSARFCNECGYSFTNEPRKGTDKASNANMLQKIFAALHFVPFACIALFSVLLFAFYSAPVAELVLGMGLPNVSLGNVYSMRSGILSEIPEVGGAMIALIIYAVVCVAFAVAFGIVAFLPKFKYKEIKLFEKWSVPLTSLFGYGSFVLYLISFILGIAIICTISSADEGMGFFTKGACPMLLIVFSLIFAALAAGSFVGRYLFAREKKERKPIDKVALVKKFVTIAEWIMAGAPMAFVILTFIFLAFPLVSLDKEVYGVKSIGNFYSAEWFLSEYVAFFVLMLVLLLILGSFCLVIRKKAKKTTLRFAIISLCISMISYILIATEVFHVSKMLYSTFIVGGLARPGAGITLVKFISIMFAVVSPLLFVAWLVIKKKVVAKNAPSSADDSVEKSKQEKAGKGKTAQKLLAVYQAFIMVCATAGSLFLGAFVYIKPGNPANQWDAFNNYIINEKCSEYGFIELSDNTRLVVAAGPKMIYDNLTALNEQIAAAEDLDEYDALMNKLDRINEKLSSAPFKAVKIKTEEKGNEKYLTEIEYNPNYKFAYKEGESTAKTDFTAGATVYDTAYCVDTRTGAKTETPLSAPYGMSYRLDFPDGGYRKGRLADFVIETDENGKRVVTWANEYGSFRAPVGDTGVELFTIDSEGTLARTNSAVAKVMWDNIPSPITSFVVPDGVTAIGKGIFKGCSTLASIDIPDSVTSIGRGAFSGCTNLQPSTTDGNAKYLGNSENPYLYLWEVNDRRITDFTIDEKTKIIGDHAFDNYYYLTSITIPANVTAIEERAFYCSNLQTITFAGESKLKSIGDEAFAGCKLTTITIPASVTSIGPYAFTDLNTVNFANPNGWKASQNSDMSNAKDILLTDLQDQTKAAQYLKNTYSNYFWKRS